MCGTVDERILTFILVLFSFILQGVAVDNVPPSSTECSLQSLLTKIKLLHENILENNNENNENNENKVSEFLTILVRTQKATSTSQFEFNSSINILVDFFLKIYSTGSKVRKSEKIKLKNA